jgi:hypothetical protein
MELEMELRAAQQEARVREQQQVGSSSTGRTGRGIQAEVPQRSDAEEAQKGEFLSDPNKHFAETM